MGFMEDAKFVLFGVKNAGDSDRDRYALTKQAVGDLDLGDLDYPGNGINRDVRNSHPHYSESNRTKLLKALAELRLNVFSVPQIASHLRADKQQIYDLLEECVADRILEKVPGKKGMYAFSDKMRSTDFSVPNRTPPAFNFASSNPYNNPYSSDNLVDFKKFIEDKLLILDKKIDFWASRIESRTDIEQKKKKPNKIISEFKGKILEIVNTLNVIEMPGTDRQLGELILQYKDARREQLYAREREIAYEVIDRLNAMVSIYIHLVRTMNEFNRYLLELYREGIIRDFPSQEEEVEEPYHPMPKRQAFPTPEPIKPETQRQTQLRPPEKEFEPLEDEEGDYADEGLDEEDDTEEDTEE